MRKPFTIIHLEIQIGIVTFVVVANAVFAVVLAAAALGLVTFGITIVFIALLVIIGADLVAFVQLCGGIDGFGGASLRDALVTPSAMPDPAAPDLNDYVAVAFSCIDQPVGSVIDDYVRAVEGNEKVLRLISRENVVRHKHVDELTMLGVFVLVIEDGSDLACNETLVVARESLAFALHCRDLDRNALAFYVGEAWFVRLNGKVLHGAGQHALAAVVARLCVRETGLHCKQKMETNGEKFMCQSPARSASVRWSCQVQNAAGVKRFETHQNCTRTKIAHAGRGVSTACWRQNRLQQTASTFSRGVSMPQRKQTMEPTAESEPTVKSQPWITQYASKAKMRFWIEENGQVTETVVHGTITWMCVTNIKKERQYSFQYDGRQMLSDSTSTAVDGSVIFPIGPWDVECTSLVNPNRTRARVALISCNATGRFTLRKVQVTWPVRSGIDHGCLVFKLIKRGKADTDAQFLRALNNTK